MENKFLNIKYICRSFEEFEWMYHHIVNNSVIDRDMFINRVDSDETITDVLRDQYDDLTDNGEIGFFMVEEMYINGNKKINIGTCSTTLENKITCEGCGGHDCKNFPFVEVKNYKRELKLKRLL